MAQTLKIDNYTSLNVVLDNLSLNADITVGATSLTLISTAGLGVGDLLVLGQRGQNGCEMVTVSGVTNATTVAIASTPTTLMHEQYEPVTKLFGNQINVYTALNVSGEQPADGSFSLQSSAAITYNQLTTRYTDANGSANYWYKYTYYNTSNSGETSLGDSGAVRGGGYGHYSSLQEIREEAGLTTNTNISDALINSRRIDAEDLINGELFELYTLPFAQPIPPTINRVNCLLAAGLLLMKEYGTMATGSSKDGSAKYAEGWAMLEKIKARETTLLDPSGQTLMLQPIVTSWPNISTDQTGADIQYSDLLSGDFDYGPAVKKGMKF